MKKIILILLLLQSNRTFSQIINGNFEIWDTTYINVYSTDLHTIFGVPNPLGGVADHWLTSSGFGTSRTTDSYSGNYALILHNWYSYAYESINYDDTLSSRPSYLQGFYKYNTSWFDGISHGYATVTLTRFNGATSDTIATGTFQFDSTIYYIPFQITLNYLSILNPDSIHINMINGDSPCLHGNICNLLYIDKLSISNIPLGIDDVKDDENAVNIYPNPTNGELNIELKSSRPIQFTLYNCIGAKVFEKILADEKNVIDLSKLAKGIYLLKLNDGIETFKMVKVIRQ